VITRSSRETEGALISAGAGTTLSTGTARYGFGLGRAHVRVFGRYTDVEPTETADGIDNRDQATRWHAGFRADWGDSAQALTVHGATFRSDIEQVPDERVVEDLHLLAEWSRRFAGGQGLRVQAYFDRSQRDQPGAIEERLDTWDVEAHHALPRLRGHELLWGAGFRHQADDIENLGPALAFIPADRDLRYGSLFAQDRVAIANDMDLVLGLRLEHNVFTEWEVLPNARLAWQLLPDRLLWLSWSRTVRAPSRIDRELFLPASPPHVVLAGGPDFVSERAQVGEIGVRATPSPLISYSVTGFLHAFDDLRSLEPSAAGPVFENGFEATVTGGEAWGSVQLTPWWGLHAGWVEQRHHLRLDPGASGIGGGASLGNDPHHYGTLRAAFEIPDRHELDLWVRFVGALPGPDVPSYTSFNVRLGLRLPGAFDLSLTGWDLLDRSHAEWGAPAARPEFRPSVFAMLRWQGWGTR
jgi:iron complex outermembrane receptor protein